MENAHESYALYSWCVVADVVFAVDSPAADADTFTAANRAQQAALLEQWAVNPDVQRIPLLSALRDENLLTDNTKNAFIMNGSHVQPLGTATAPNGELKNSPD